MMWMLRVLRMVVAHNVSEYRYMDDVTENLAGGFENLEIKIHVYVKRETWICTTWPSFFLNCRLLFITSAQK